MAVGMILGVAVSASAHSSVAFCAPYLVADVAACPNPSAAA